MYFVNSVDDTSFVTAIKYSNVVELLYIWLQWGGLEWGVLCSCVWTSFVPHTLSKTKIDIKNYHRGNCRKSNVFSIQALKKNRHGKKNLKPASYQVQYYYVGPSFAIPSCSYTDNMRPLDALSGIATRTLIVPWSQKDNYLHSEFFL